MPLKKAKAYKKPHPKPLKISEPVSLYDAKTHLSELVEKAAAGTEIIISKSGKPKARLVPLETEDLKQLRVPGKGKGQVWISDAFDDPLPPELLALFYQPLK